MTQFKEGYIKGTPEQIKELRHELLKVGFTDDEWWNDKTSKNEAGFSEMYIHVEVDGEIGVYNHNSTVIAFKYDYTLSPDENLAEAAQKIYELSKI